MLQASKHSLIFMIFREILTVCLDVREIKKFIVYKMRMGLYDTELRLHSVT